MGEIDAGGRHRQEPSPPTPLRLQKLPDAFGRRHDSLRISVTDRCNIRCFYCMPREGARFVPHPDILTFEEIARFAKIAARWGVRKIRITGGEPLVRPDLPVLIGKLSAIPAIADLALTTNGILLAEQGRALHEAGLRRINVHLDTLDRDRFMRITQCDGLRRVLKGIETCQRLGYGPIKLNTVAVKGLSEPDIVPLARFARENGLELRFVEFMPLDAQGLWSHDKVFPADDLIRIVSREVCPLVAVPDGDSHSSATEYAYADGAGKVGFVASVSRPFCLSCNRVRLTADGRLRYCLFAIDETDVRALLRGSASEEEIGEALRATVWAKWRGHNINSQDFAAPPRSMYAIGG